MNRQVSFENGDWLHVCTTSGKVQAIVAGFARKGKPPHAIMAMTRAQAVALRDLLSAAIAASEGLERPQVKIEGPGRRIDVV